MSTSSIVSAAQSKSRSLFGAAAIAVACLALGGCSAAADDTGEGVTSEAELRRSRKIDLSPSVSDMIDEYMSLFKPKFEAARAAHPEITTLTRGSLEAFSGPGWSLETALETFLDSRSSHEVEVDDALSSFRTWVAKEIRDAAGSDGRVGDSLDEMPGGLGSFFTSARDNLKRQLMVTALHDSDGIRIETMLGEWSRVEKENDLARLGAPYQMSGRVTASAVQSVLGLRDLAPQKTGDAAVVSFVNAVEEANEQNLGALKTMWTSSSVKSQYLFEYGEDGIGAIVLAIVDEHGQLFSFALDYEA